MRRNGRIRTGVALAATLVLVACGNQQPSADIDGVEDADALDEVEDVDAADADAAPGSEDTPSDDPEAEGDLDAGGGEAGPEPDAAAVADPCAAHGGREGDAFIDLVAPVDDQAVRDELEIVGCSNVYEATVAWRLLGGDGQELAEGFTTAECGSGCVGAFREVVSLDAAAGEAVAYLEVFWDSPADGEDVRDLTEVRLALP